jgi:putative colanic acid biosynthesis UDP-glucose lipid carrier transferase
MQSTSITRQERRRSIRSNRRSFSSFYRLLDMTVITTVYLCILVVSQVNIELTNMILLLVSIISFNFCAEVMNLYRFGRAPSSFVMLKTISVAWCFTALLTAIFAFILPTSLPYSASLTLVFDLALTLPTLVISRAVLTKTIRFFRIKGFNTRTAIIIGTTPGGYKLATQFEEEKSLGIHFLGFYEDRKSDRVPNNMQYLVRGDVSNALELAHSNQVDYVYIALPIIAADRISEMLHKFAKSAAKLNLISDPFVDTLINARGQQIGSIQTISLFRD